jgi:hypothetical protein
MAYFPNEATQGYPTGDATRSTYWPNSPSPASTANPHGVPNSPHEYTPKTIEAKAAAMVPPGVFATVVN